MSAMIEMKVSEIRVATDDTPPVVVLAEVGGEGRLLPIWMTHGGASAILEVTEEPDDLRPSIHDLTAALVERLVSSEFIAADIVNCDEGHFYATLVFADHSLPARASDAIALAMRRGVPIRCRAELLAEWGVAAEAIASSTPEPTEDEVERFLEFLDSVTPDDFTGEDKP
jgi:bifunctional DNase/RNase